MEDFLMSGRAIDLVVGIIVLEAIVLTAWWGRQHLRTILLTLLPGLMLLLATRAAISNSGWAWVAVFITAALPLHLLDLWFRRPK